MSQDSENEGREEGHVAPGGDARDALDERMV